MQPPNLNFKLFRFAFLCVSMLSCFQMAAQEMPLTVLKGLDASELNESKWLLAGRAELTQEPAVIINFGSAIFESLPDRNDYFVIYNDSLVWTGYSVDINLGFLAEPPLTLSDSRFSLSSRSPLPYLCRGKLDVNTHIRELGDYEFIVIRDGMAIVSPTDTLHNICLTRQIFNHRTIIGDSVNVDMPDIETFRWYKSGELTPIAVQRNGKLFFNESIVESALKTGVDEKSSVEHIKEIIDNVEIVQQPNSITILLPESINLTAFLMDEAGNIYGVTSGVDHTFSINLNGLPSNRYILSLVAEPEALYVRKELIIL